MLPVTENVVKKRKAKTTQKLNLRMFAITTADLNPKPLDRSTFLTEQMSKIDLNLNIGS